MLPFRSRTLRWIDRAQAVSIVCALLGSVLAIGGLAWWWRPALAVIATFMVASSLLRVVVQGNLRLIVSPIPVLAFFALCLATVQLVPLPGSFGRHLSSESRALYSTGVLEHRAKQLDPNGVLPAGIGSRSPLTIDRALTFRWLVDGLLWLVVLITVRGFATRLRKSLVVWSSLIAVFGLTSLSGFMELLAASTSGDPTPSLIQSLPWGPSALDRLSGPGFSRLHPIDSGAELDPSESPWLFPRMEPPLLGGGLAGDSGGLMALASIALPITLGLLLQSIAPRGSSESLGARLRYGSNGARVALLSLLAFGGACLVGLLGNPLLAGPFLIGILVIALLAGWKSGVFSSTVLVTILCSLSIGLGLMIRAELGWNEEGDPRVVVDANSDPAKRLPESCRIVRDFPWVGTGLGTFGRIHPHYKETDISSQTASSSMLQWLVESGLCGGILGLLGVLWILWRFPKAWSSIGSADRPIAAGLIGSIVTFGLFSLVHWTLELPAVALATAGLMGTVDRWFVGGTDLFVDSA